MNTDKIREALPSVDKGFHGPIHEYVDMGLNCVIDYIQALEHRLAAIEAREAHKAKVATECLAELEEFTKGKG